MARRRKTLTPEDYESLKRAHEALEYPRFAARVTGMLGTPVQEGLRLLPRSVYGYVRDATEAAVARALGVAITTLRHEEPGFRHDAFHRRLAMATGALGGFFGLPAVLLELPFTTVVMLRSIADVANSFGENLDALETRFACMEVFAVGGRSPGDDNVEIGYYEVRAALAFHFSTLASANGGLTTAYVPAAVGLVRAIAARFGVVVSDKLAMQMVPVLGAASGAMINSVFTRYFQDVARGHFTLRDLERRYDPATVETEYRKLSEKVARAERAASGWRTRTAAGGTMPAGSV